MFYIQDTYLNEKRKNIDKANSLNKYNEKCYKILSFTKICGIFRLFIIGIFCFFLSLLLFFCFLFKISDKKRQSHLFFV